MNQSSNQSSHPLSRWLRSRQLLTDSGYGVASHHTYPSFAIEQLSDMVFILSVIMPPCSDDQLTISLDGLDLAVVAMSKDKTDKACEHKFHLLAPTTIAGANWDNGNLFIELICAEAPDCQKPAQFIVRYSGRGSWLRDRQNAQTAAPKAA